MATRVDHLDGVSTSNGSAVESFEAAGVLTKDRAMSSEEDSGGKAQGK